MNSLKSQEFLSAYLLTWSHVPRNHSEFLFSYKVSRGIHSVLNSGVTGFCFKSKLRKSSDDCFLFWSPQREIGDLRKTCVAVSLETLHEYPTIHALQKSATTGCWKLLSEISRTTPDYKLTNGMCLLGSKVCLPCPSIILRIMVMLQSHSDALIFQIDTFHIG